ncbi:MAG: NAD(+)/NADH kinase [Planctomycetes bacterium]|nr:NAD(+)/NADH kinase [Planctomycetota bacterium]
MTRQIAIFGGSFNPPGAHHREIAARLAEQFDQVIVIPCGPRPDKPATAEIAPIHRATMADLAFGNLPRMTVDLSDLENATFTRSRELQSRFAAQGSVWHVVTHELIQGGSQGKSIIQQQWDRGSELWQQAQFVVVQPRETKLATSDLPPHHRLLPVEKDGEGLHLRAGVFEHRDVSKLLPANVAAYIERYGLYRGGAPRQRAALTLGEPRLELVVDDVNGHAKALAANLASFVHATPELLVTIGGDGTMLGAIRSHWRRRLPLFGWNAGHLGFLLNDEGPLAREPREFVVEHLPLMHVEIEGIDGKIQTALAFNDTWVERATGQTAWIEVVENGQTRIEKLVGDGVLVSTAAGSTAYARAMGATSLPLGTQAFLLVGSNVLRPTSWRPVVLPFDSVIELRAVDENKRPLAAFIDGVPYGNVRRLTARISRVAAVELAFHPDTDLAAKLARIQFPAQ